MGVFLDEPDSGCLPDFERHTQHTPHPSRFSILSQPVSARLLSMLTSSNGSQTRGTGKKFGRGSRRKHVAVDIVRDMERTIPSNLLSHQRTSAIDPANHRAQFQALGSVPLEWMKPVLATARRAHRAGRLLLGYCAQSLRTKIGPQCGCGWRRLLRGCGRGFPSGLSGLPTWWG